MKKFLLFVLISLQSAVTFAAIGRVATEEKGRLNPTAFGAKGDGAHDDTNALQIALDSLDKMGGGAIYLGSGTFMVSSIKLGKKTSLIGCGNGATLIKQIKGTKADCVVVQAKSAALRISNLSIVGNDANCGLMVENTKGSKGENHPYLYTKGIKDGVPQPYKWMTIDDVCIYHFGTGLNIESAGFNINICNSTFSHNVIGVRMRCTDSSIYNCYITNNKKDGLYIGGSNNKISNVKSIFNGKADPMTSAAVVVHGNRCQITNCETQDNFCKGFCVEGQYNLLSNCISNTDGYAKDSKGNPSLGSCGFVIKSLYNSFTNCCVTNYNEKEGVVYYSPVMVDDAVSCYYPDIFNDIKVLIDKDKLLFHEPFKNVQTLYSKNVIRTENKTRIGDGDYFVSSSSKKNIINAISCGLSSLNVLVDFRCEEERGNIVSVVANDDLTISVVNKSLCVFWKEQKKAELVLDQDVVMNQDDLRLIFSCANSDGKLVVSLLCYEKTTSRGWIKKEVRQETDIPVLAMKTANVRIGDNSVAIKRLAISNIPMPESVYLPYSNTNGIYDGSVVYVDADSYM